MGLLISYQNCGKNLNSQLDTISNSKLVEAENCSNPSKDKYVVKIYVKKPGTKIRAPLFDNVDYSVQINWGDGKRDLISSAHDPLAVHSYEELGYYVVSFDGYYPQLGFDPNIKLNQENHFNWNIQDVCRWGKNQ